MTGWLKMILISLIANFYGISVSGQLYPKPCPKISPNTIYEEKQDSIFKSMKVKSKKIVKSNNGKVYHTYIENYDKNGNEILTGRRKERASITPDLKFISGYEENDFVVRNQDSTIISVYRNRFNEEHLIYTHEGFSNERDTIIFKSIFKLDKDFKIISLTVFDFKNHDRDEEEYYTRFYYYDEEGRRVKLVKISTIQVEPEVSIFEYYENGLMKSSSIKEQLREYSYEFW